MIQLKNITKSFSKSDSKNILYENMDFEVKSWEFIAIVWRSGSGKSTILNLISGLLSPDSGKICIDNQEITKLSQDEMTKTRGKNMSFIFQQFHLIPNLTVSENITLPIEINKIQPAFSTDQILKKVWLSEKSESYPYELSWWEQQRVAVARAFAAQTSILLADEPTGNLDEKNAKNVMDILLQLHKETQNTIVLITHDMQVAQYADKIYTLEDKQLILKK